MNTTQIFLDSLPLMTKELALDTIDKMAENLTDTFADRDMTEADIETMNTALTEALDAAGISLDDYLDYLIEKEE